MHSSYNVVEFYQFNNNCFSWWFKRFYCIFFILKYILPVFSFTCLFLMWDEIHFSDLTHTSKNHHLQYLFFMHVIEFELPNFAHFGIYKKSHLTGSDRKCEVNICIWQSLNQVIHFIIQSTVDFSYSWDIWTELRSCRIYVLLYNINYGVIAFLSVH